MIHAPLVLPVTAEIVAAVMPDARYVEGQYKHRPSVYETNFDRILRGLISEETLARHRGARRADVRHPWRDKFDVFPDIEVRTVQRPTRRHDLWADVALTLYRADVDKVDRRWVLAVLGDDDVRFYGWQTGPALLLPEPVKTRSRGGREYLISGMLHPDELLPMDTLA